jgi:small subunit ribosomal protein S9
MATASTKTYFYGLGRRKSATARVRLMAKKGEITINDKSANDYLDGSKFLLNQLVRPFSSLELKSDDYSVSVKVSGGGQNSQVGAISLGIAKALVEMNEDFRGSLRRAELLGRDPREKERKKFGLRGARKKQQYSKR